MNGKLIQERKGDVLLNLKVKPNSDKSEIVGVNEWDNRLHVKLKSPARDNEANEELLEMMGEMFGKEVRLFSGAKSKKKTLLVKNISKEKVFRTIEV